MKTNEKWSITPPLQDLTQENSPTKDYLRNFAQENTSTGRDLRIYLKKASRLMYEIPLRNTHLRGITYTRIRLQEVTYENSPTKSYF